MKHAKDLLETRRAQSVWARTLLAVPDERLRADLDVARCIAALALQARMTALSIEARPNRPSTCVDSPDRVDLAATLRPDALRALSHHSALHLDVTWRDLPAVAWDTPVFGYASVSATIHDREKALCRATAKLIEMMRQ